MSNQSNVITVSLNPSLDRTVTVRYLSEGYDNRVTAATRLDPAGEGVSISRAIHSMGGKTHPLILLGDDPVGRAYEAVLEADGDSLPYTIVQRRGDTRSDTIIVDEGRESETHLFEDFNTLTPADLDAVDHALAGLIQPEDWVVLAGTRLADWPEDTYPRLLQTVHRAGGHSIVATIGADFNDVAALNPSLMVLTKNQVERHFNYPVRHLTEVAACARQITHDGVKRVLIILEEERQAILRTENNDYLLDLPDSDHGTRSGVWEGLLAGYLLGRLQERPLTEALEMGVAAATYTANQVGSEFGSVEEIDLLRDDIDVQPLN